MAAAAPADAAITALTATEEAAAARAATRRATARRAAENARSTACALGWEAGEFSSLGADDRLLVVEYLVHLPLLNQIARVDYGGAVNPLNRCYINATLFFYLGGQLGRRFLAYWLQRASAPGECPMSPCRCLAASHAVLHVLPVAVVA